MSRVFICRTQIFLRKGQGMVGVEGRVEGKVENGKGIDWSEKGQTNKIKRS